jgi:hypothetical protein
VGKAKHAAGQLALLMLDQHKEGSFGNRIVVLARETGLVPTAEEFVSKSAHGQVDLDRERRQMVKDTYPANFGGKIFFRADYSQAMSNGDTLYDAFVYTKFREYYIGETIIAGSPEGLELGASSLQGISFQDDKPDPKCVMSADESPSSGGIVGGVLSSKPGQSNSAQPQRVRVSQGVSTGLLVTKVQPQYPEDARQARIQGSVVLKAVIDKNGGVEELTLVSGHPLLAPAALEAVKQLAAH